MKVPGPLGALLTPGATPKPVIHPTTGRTWEGIPRMPATFGRQPGPRQRPDRGEGYRTDVGSTLATWVAARADEDHLTALMPPGFTVADPLLIVEAITLSGLPWLAGRGYEMLMVSIPVAYAAGEAEYRGRLELVTWEDCPDAIVSGREELGFNKVYADTMVRHTGQDGHSERYVAAWGGTTFFELEVALKRTPAPPAAWRQGPLMHYRVLARTAAWGEAEVEQVTANSAAPPLTAMRSLQTGTGSFRFIPAGFEQLPTLTHIVGRLAAIPLGEIVDAGQARTASWADVSDIQVLSSAAPVAFQAPAPAETVDV